MLRAIDQSINRAAPSIDLLLAQASTDGAMDRAALSMDEHRPVL